MSLGCFCLPLKSISLPVDYCILVCLTGHNTKTQGLLKPSDGLLKVADTDLDPTCPGHFQIPFPDQTRLDR